MADSALARGLWDEAAGLYQRAIERYGNSSDEPIVADCLRGLARANIARGRFVEAEKAANRGLAIDEDYWGGGCSQVGESYYLMAEAARYQGALGRAEFFYLEALTVSKLDVHQDEIWGWLRRKPFDRRFNAVGQTNDLDLIIDFGQEFLETFYGQYLVFNDQHPNHCCLMSGKITTNSSSDS